MGRQWVRRYVKARPNIFVYDDADLPDIIKSIGGGHWFGTIFISKRQIEQVPDAWWSSVLIHEFVHHVQRERRIEKYAGLALLGAGGLGAYIIAARIEYPNLEMERGAEYVQFSILYEMNDPGAIQAALPWISNAKREDLAVEICNLKAGGPDVYAAIRHRNPCYGFWADSDYFNDQRDFPESF